MKKNGAPLAVKRCHDLLLWMIPQLDKFPRARRFTIGERIENSLLEVLRCLLEAAYQPRSRQRALNKANIEITVIRHLWRAAFRLGAIASRSYNHGSKLLVELGQQTGGWAKHKNSANLNESGV